MNFGTANIPTSAIRKRKRNFITNIQHMETDIKKYIVQTAQNEWKLLTEEGGDTNGIYFKMLRNNEAQKRPGAC